MPNEAKNYIPTLKRLMWFNVNPPSKPIVKFQHNEDPCTYAKSPRIGNISKAIIQWKPGTIWNNNHMKCKKGSWSSRTQGSSGNSTYYKNSKGHPRKYHIDIRIFQSWQGTSKGRSIPPQAKTDRRWHPRAMELRSRQEVVSHKYSTIDNKHQLHYHSKVHYKWLTSQSTPTKHNIDDGRICVSQWQNWFKRMNSHNYKIQQGEGMNHHNIKNAGYSSPYRNTPRDIPKMENKYVSNHMYWEWYLNETHKALSSETVIRPRGIPKICLWSRTVMTTRSRHVGQYHVRFVSKNPMDPY